MMAYGNDLDIFIGQLQSLILSIVVKRDDYAAKYETVESRSNADRYIAMIEGGGWDSFVIFDYDVLKAAGFDDDFIRAIYADSKDLIPYEYRDLVSRLQREKILTGYIEMNDYYRMLNGEPPLDADEKDFVYMPENPYGIPTDVPIHLLEEGYIQYFNSSGLRESVYMANPTKKYLLFLGNHKIPYYRARTAHNFDILYYETCNTRSISDAFTRYYANCRNYVVRNLYNKADQRMYEYYDAYMGFLIIHMTTQQIFTSIFPQGIRREFYDDNLIRCLFEAYNIPYIESIDVPYQRDIAKKLNVLLQKKASNAVLFDVTSLFHYSAINIYKYYLVKDYYKDEAGDPVIIYKTVYDENNVAHRVIDPEKTYDIYFQKVNLKSKDIPAEIGDPSNRIEYDALCGGDPYWFNDADLLNKVYNSRFNNILTKYMSIDISYELAQLMYETSYGIRVAIDDQKDFKNLYIQLPYVKEPVSLYDTVIFLCALVAKKFKLAGNVPLKPYQIAQVYGFNFKTDIDMLKQKIIDDIESCTGEYKSVREELLSYLKTLNTTTLEGVRQMYADITKLRVWLDTAMRYSNDIEEYEAYKKIYNSVLLVHDVEELYTKKDGTYAETYAELLEDRRPDLWEVLDKSGKVETVTEPGTTTDKEADFSINNKINKILEKLSLISEELSEMRYANDKDALVSNIEKVINQLKSYTVDQTQSSIMYLINDPHMCMLKIIDNIRGSNIEASLRHKLKILYNDTLGHIIYSRNWDKLPIRDAIISDKLVYLQDLIEISDAITDGLKINDLGTRYMLYDLLRDYSKRTKLADQPLYVRDYIDATGYWQIEEFIHLWNKIIHGFKEGFVNEPIGTYHTLGLNTLVNVNHYLRLLNILIVEVNWDINQVLKFPYTIDEFKSNNIDMKSRIVDNIGVFNERVLADKTLTRDEIKRYSWEIRYHTMFIGDKIQFNKYGDIDLNIHLQDMVGMEKDPVIVETHASITDKLYRFEVDED